MSPRLILLILCGLAPAWAADLVIRNARIVDGTGNPWFIADVAVDGGRISAIGRLADTQAGRTIDAAGRVLAPGFIDVHTHVEKRSYRPGIDDFPDASNYTTDGKTTIVTGNCGFSEVDLGEWYKRLESQGLGLNLASLAGHNSIRERAMGSDERRATPEELARMRRLAEKAMRDGAVGFSTGLIYIPGTYSDTAEVMELAKAAGRFGGVYATHMRDEGAKVLDAIREAVEIGQAAQVPVQISHFKVSNKRLWGASRDSVELVESYRRQGVDVVVDQYPYDRSSTNLGITLPSWALAGGQSKLEQRLGDPATRARIVRDMQAKLGDLGHDDYSYAMVASCQFEPALAGKTISEVNVLRGRPRTVEAEIETILELIRRGPMQMVYHSMGMEDVERIAKYPNTAIASDGYIVEFASGVPHPRSYGTYARVLAEFVRERRWLTLEDAIRRMTSLPARTFGFRDRGLIREGMAADLVLFDPARVQDRATFENPHQYSDGFDLVLVNGVAVVEEGKPTGKRPGQILRRQ